MRSKREGVYAVFYDVIHDFTGAVFDRRRFGAGSGVVSDPPWEEMPVDSACADHGG